MSLQNNENIKIFEKELFEKICASIGFEEQNESEKTLKNLLTNNVLKMKDSQGRSLLMFACMSDKPKIANILLKKGLKLEEKDISERTLLHWAVKCNSIKIIKWLLQLPINENFILLKDIQGVTSIHIAATKSSSKILRLLLSVLTKNENLLSKILDSQNRIPLHYAASFGSIECVEEFMDESLNLPVSLRDVYGNTPLMLACGNNYASEVIRCLSNKKSVSVTSRNGYGMSPLHIGVLTNNINGVKILLQECKISTEIYDDDARTPLHYAAQNGRVEIVELLLEAGARYNAVDAYGATPAHYAAEISWPILQSLLIKNNHSDVIDKEGRTPFMWSVISGNENIVINMLRNFNISRNSKDNQKSTALHLAALTGNSSMCKMLIQQGWMLTAEDEVGATPLHIAAGKGFTYLVDIFSTTDDIIRKVDIAQRTALYYAALGGQAHTLNVMISDLGFDANVQDIHGRTPLHAAAYSGFVACIQKLIDHGVDVNAIDRDEETPLHVACSRGKEEIVYILENAGANVNAYSNITKATPISYAISNKHIKIVEFLKEKGAIIDEKLLI
ncbi:Inversin [Strongyloides ratti]|uniref:Inversin n=1 Tax=Strongyloides ratti TaxID=34506 RepID=A0A090LB11_STRRB|nr:Inversin [Strongyloides ratti]CEF65303.1 Inversin [Strongyloides ratti]